MSAFSGVSVMRTFGKNARERKANTNKLIIKETADYHQFWDILSNNLQKQYDLKPVHTLDEIMLLAKRFPENIRLFCSYLDNIMLAGAVVYLSKNVCHIQYNAASEIGKKYCAQDLILNYLIEHRFSTVKYIDFGVSTEDEGKYLNTGLAEYKEGFGARTIVHDLYKIDLYD